MIEKTYKNKLLLPTITIVSLAIIFFYPRLIISLLGPADPWTSYLYQYGLGLLVFSIGITLILKTKACVLGRGKDSFWFKWLIGGFICFAIMHAIWIYLSLSMPVKGGM